MRPAGGELRHRSLWLAAGWALVGLLVFLSLTPDPPTPLEFSSADKLEHTLAYGLLMGWFMQIYATRRARVSVAVALVVLGISLEFLQARTAVRTFDPADMVANSTGVILAWLLVTHCCSQLLLRLERLFAAKITFRKRSPPPPGEG